MAWTHQVMMLMTLHTGDTQVLHPWNLSKVSAFSDPRTNMPPTSTVYIYTFWGANGSSAYSIKHPSKTDSWDIRKTQCRYNPEIHLPFDKNVQRWPWPVIKTMATLRRMLISCCCCLRLLLHSIQYVAFRSYCCIVKLLRCVAVAYAGSSGRAELKNDNAIGKESSNDLETYHHDHHQHH